MGSGEGRTSTSASHGLSLPTCLAVPRLVHIRRRFSIDGGAGLPDVYRCAALSLDD
jgi:hypothetical protein